MNRRVRWMIALGAGALTIFAAMGARPARSQDAAHPGETDWPLVGGDLGNVRYSKLAQINPRTIQQLAGAWISPKFDDGAPSRSMPVIQDGMIFVTAGSYVYALDAKTGQIAWKFGTGAQITEAERARGINWASSSRMLPNAQGVAIGDGKVFVGLTDGHVLALSEKSGELAWVVQAGDELKPKDEGRMVPNAPTYDGGVVFVGTNGDYGVNAKIVAFDSKTGKQLWHFFVIPRPGEAGHETWPQTGDVWAHGGGGVWQTGVVDADLGLVYFGTGNTVPQYGGEIRAGDNLYTDCVIALDVKTGKLRWYYQLVHHDIWEADIALPVILYDTQVDGRAVKGVAAMRPDGYLFLLDRATGKPLVPVEERPVTQSSFQKTAPTQPFPVVPEGLLPACASWKESVPKGWTLDCEFYPWDFGAMVLAPGFTVRVTPMAYSPQTSYFYAQGSDAIRPHRLATEDPWFFALGSGDLGVLGLPAGRSFVAAIDARTDKVAWKKEVPPAELGRSYAGPFATAGGLLFRSTSQGALEAWDAKTGDSLWQFQTGAQTGPIATYELDGEQYIAMVAGPSVWAFKLGGTIKPVPAAERPRAAGGADAGAVDTDQIEVASLVRDNGNSGQRYATDEHAFNPSRARVKVGTRVIWLNNGNMVHTIVAKDGSWSTDALNPADSAGVTFDKPGTYLYYCKEHPWAVGEVIVVSDSQERGSTGGVYTPEQAQRGKAAYSQSCSGCHQADLSGTSQFPALKGDAFLAEWQGHPVSDLVDRTRSTMPQGNPGSLGQNLYLDIVTYILQINGQPSGRAELKADSAEITTPMGK